MGKRSATSVTAEEAKSKSKSSSSAITLTNGFLAVPVAFPNDIKHWIYVRKHTAPSASAASTSQAVEALPAERTLFVANLPTDTTEEHVRELFGKVGGVSVVKFRRQIGVDEQDEDEREERGVGEGGDSDEDAEEQGEREEEHHQVSAETSGKKKKKSKQQPARKSKVPQLVPLPTMDPRVAAGSQAFLSTSSSAHIVFLDTLSSTRAFELFHKGGIRWPTLSASRTTPPPTGLDYLLSAYTLARPALPAIQTYASSAIALYTYRRAHPLPRAIGVRGVTVGPSGELLDEDGFIIVQRSTGKYGRAGASADAGGSVGVAKHGFVENTKKKSTGLEDFYRFQLREKKREQLADLRAKFEADKAKVDRLKAGRRFKPY
ncbi:hypothetical protein EX895_005220 [Sporisorium graminicola]|uniref:RRM domain-containing protein n=1 Tax=Sporisorium graminicola TaxID=280036 RepID=A0A4U7KMZ6_9BASI|nr:hypothetical protein EX895_005220 [Sporisorium graminicola]TKY85680.1 hypothetical protein EX895_005220 [Sporisorium graminicola]